MRRSLALAALLLVPASASADAIIPFEGDCPPGSDKGIIGHAEGCIPRQCESDGDCGMGASCQRLCVCRAEREVHGNGRVFYDEPRMIEVEVGVCDGSGACAEGEASHRSQCEPDSETPAFDPRTHRWTGQPHEGGCAGCAVPRGAGPASVVPGSLALLLWLRRRPL